MFINNNYLEYNNQNGKISYIPNEFLYLFLQC